MLTRRSMRATTSLFFLLRLSLGCGAPRHAATTRLKYETCEKCDGGTLGASLTLHRVLSWHLQQILVECQLLKSPLRSRAALSPAVGSVEIDLSSSPERVVL